ncbi:MAG TPA: hypothetical protein PLP33_24540 [Leptospiraceae bacterium]|nr:hypothetical protein [Leptospiraceae bacterium]
MLNLINEVFLEAGIVTHEEKMEGIKRFDSSLVREAKRVYWLINDTKRAISGDSTVMEYYTYTSLDEFKKGSFYAAIHEYKTHFLTQYLMSKGILKHHPYCPNCAASVVHRIHVISKPADYSIIRDGMKKLKEMQKTS